MSFQSIRVEGTLFSAELIARLDDGFAGQAPKDFSLPPRARVRDRIMESWGDLSEQWHVFRRRRERLPEGEAGTTETRRFWMEPFFAALGYELELQKSGEMIQGRNYAISHRDTRRAGLPVHIAGCGTSLDAKPNRGGLSPHALVQEYLNLTDRHLFAVVTNGIALRLVRDCGRISRLSYVEFDLERMFEGDLYAEFALLYRFLHASRFSGDPEEPGTCVLEDYHQASVEEGGRIRAHLSKAVEEAITTLGDGFLAADANGALREAQAGGKLSAADYYHELLFLVYRLLFLMVIEERGLVFGPGSDPAKAAIYERFYSIKRLRKLTTVIHADLDRHDDWYRLLGEIFALFDEKGSGKPLGIAPLGGDLFRSEALPWLKEARLPNRALRDALGRLDSFQDEKSRFTIRVNYASLNVEEFGSVYEGLLELEPVFTAGSGRPGFGFSAGTSRGDTGSHYTPDELVQKLVKAGVDPSIEGALAEAAAKVKAKGLSGKAYAQEAEKALLGLRVLDSACGSGHMLLGAARRIGLELARIRHDEDQPSPGHLRQAVRDAISHCLYGVDMNPLAAELCKVALWLEAHEPGKPLGFLDHRIKCGDSLAGLGRFEELEAGIPDEAFRAKPGDDKKAASALAKRNRKERAELEVRQTLMDWGSDWASSSRTMAASGFARVESLGDRELAEAEAKREGYESWLKSESSRALHALADIKVAQYFLTLVEGQEARSVTEGSFRACLRGEGRAEKLSGYPAAREVAGRRRFFHWFMEFPTVFEGKEGGEGGGFDVIIGNPPFLGGQKLSGTFGNEYLAWLKENYPPAGAMDLVGFFFRRNFDLLRASGRLALIATKTIAEGGTREGSLDVIAKTGTIYWAVKSMPWPGKAAVSVSLAAICKGKIEGQFTLNGKPATVISPYLDDAKALGNPYRLAENAGKSFQGSIVLGSGFVLEPEEAQALIAKNPKNKDVLFPYLNGEDLNSRPDGSPSRWVINFFDWPLRRKKAGEAERPEDVWECAAADYKGAVAEEYPDCLEIVERLVKPERQRLDEKGEYIVRKPMPHKWWIYGEKRPGLYRSIRGIGQILCIATQATKYVCFGSLGCNYVYSHAIAVIVYEERSVFCLVSSSIHDCWAWKHASQLEGRLRFAPSDAFETFPFPPASAPGIPSMSSRPRCASSSRLSARPTTSIAPPS